MKRILAVALVAVLALLALRPFCDLALAGGAHGDCARLWSSAGQHAAGHPDPATDSTVECRGSIDDTTLVTPGEPLALWSPQAPPVPALLAFAGLLRFAGARNTVRFRLAVPPERPFYARSVRILR